MRTIKSILRDTLRGALHLYPFYSGVVRITQSPLFTFLASGTGLKVVTLRTGQKIVVDPSDYCGKVLYYWGDYDARITHLCIASLRPGETMLDIGANYGEIALAAASKVGASGSVHAFEPNPLLCDLLRRSASLNEFAQLHVHQVALGEYDGSAELTAPNDNTGAASMTIEYVSGKRISIEVRNAAEYLRALDLTKLAVVKLDVEGMEAVILASAMSLFERLRPRVIAFESKPEGCGFFERPAVRCLSRLGYEFYQVSINARLTNLPVLRLIQSEDNVADGYDFAAIMPDCISDLAGRSFVIRNKRGAFN